jgi:hypothetical protein
VAASRRLSTAPVLLAAGIGILGWTLASRAQQGEVNVQFHAFQDSRGVTVLSPTVDLDKDFTDRLGLRLKFGVDAVSAASDSCIRCHRDGADNRRVFVNAGLQRPLGKSLFSLGGEYSQENFYQATTALTSISRAFNQDNTTIAGGYSFSLNRPQLHPSEDWEQQYSQTGFVSVTQNVTKLTTVQAGVEIGHISGYQANPFLRALVNGVRELGNAPDLRTRRTYTARVRQALPAETYLEADYRRYGDTWDVRSNTFSVGLSHYFKPSLMLNGSYRRYGQTGAFFWAPQYTGNPQYFTADFRLEPFDSNLYSGRLIYTPADPWFFVPKGSSLTLQYERYAATSGFRAATFSTGLRIPLSK